MTQAGITYDAVDIGLKGMLQAQRICPEGLVPVLYLDGEILAGSDKIVRWAEANAAPGTPPLRCDDPAVSEWEAWADETVGPATRRDAYRVLHEKPFAADVPFAIKLAARVGRGAILSVLKYYKTRRYDESDAVELPAAVARVAKALGGGDYLLGGETPTVADHAVAALMRPLLYVESARGLASWEGWADVKAHMERVRPAKTTLARKHWIRKKDWDRLETIHVAWQEGKKEGEELVAA